MRYFLVSYFRKPNGQTDEEVSLAKRLRLKDLQSAAVILDFQSRKVIKSSLVDVVIPKDWHRIRDYYHQHYGSIIDDLEQTHGTTHS